MAVCRKRAVKRAAKKRELEARGYAKAWTQNWLNEKGTVSVLGGRDG